jgi:hypothetical protein
MAGRIKRLRKREDTRPPIKFHGKKINLIIII